MSMTDWISNGTNISYEPKEKNTGEVITPFTTTAPGGVPNSSYAPSTYVLAASGAWIPQTVSTSSSEIRRPSAYTLLAGSSPTFTDTDTSLVYDSDVNHVTTNGLFDLSGNLSSDNASFKFSSFQSKAQTWTSATLNISRNYTTIVGAVANVKFYLSTDGGSNWGSVLLTDDYDNDPTAPAIFSYTLPTANPSSLSNYQVKVEMYAEKTTGLRGVYSIILQLYDIWIEGIYSTSGGSGTVTSITTTGANGISISGGSTQTITTSGTFALALGNITPTSISTGTGSFTGDVEFASSIKSPNGSNSPVVIAPDGTGDLHVNADSLRLGDNNANSTIATNGTGDLILTTNEGSATEGIIRIYDGANGNITLTPNGTGQVQVGSDQVVTLTASQTLTNKTISGASNTLTNIGNASLTNSTISGVSLGSNLYALTISSPLTGSSYNGSSAVSIGIPAATSSVSGYLTSTDWNTFNNKGSGTVTSVSVVTANGVSGTVATATTTPAITLSLGAITPTSVASTGAVSGTTASFTTSVTTPSLTNAGTLALSATGANVITASTNGSERMRIDNSGNVGIGYSSPSTIVTGNGVNGLVIGNGSGTWGLTVYSGTSSSGRLFFADGTTGADPYVGQIQYDHSNNSMQFVTNASERMRIDSSGNVGIGVTPSAWGGSFATTQYKGGFIGSQSGSYIYSGQNSYFNGTDWKYVATAAATLHEQSAGNLIWYNAASGTAGNTISWTERMRLDSSGNLGLGTASPARRLHVVGADNTNPAVVIANSNSNNSILQFGSSGTVYQILGGDYQGNMNISIGGDYPIVFTTNSSEKMRLNSTGLGIGTSSPASKLNVSASNVTVSAGYGIAYSADQNRIMTPEDNVSGALISWGSGGICRFRAGSSTEVARLDSSGNLGLGTASPLQQLHLSSASATGMQITYQGVGASRIGVASGNALTFGLDTSNGATERMRIDSSGNVGIGTSSPRNKLDVVGDVVMGRSGGSLWYFQSPSSDMRIVGDTSGAHLCLIPNSANVGIGTTSPSEKLNVSGKIKASDVLLGNNGTKGYGAITTTTSTSTPTGGSSGDHYYIY